MDLRDKGCEGKNSFDLNKVRSGGGFFPKSREFTN